MTVYLIKYFDRDGKPLMLKFGKTQNFKVRQESLLKLPSELLIKRKFRNFGYDNNIERLLIKHSKNFPEKISNEWFWYTAHLEAFFLTTIKQGKIKVCNLNHAKNG